MKKEINTDWEYLIVEYEKNFKWQVILQFLRKSPKKSFTYKEIEKATSLTKGQTYRTVQDLKKNLLVEVLQMGGKKLAYIKITPLGISLVDEAKKRKGR